MAKNAARKYLFFSLTEIINQMLIFERRVPQSERGNDHAVRQPFDPPVRARSPVRRRVDREENWSAGASCFQALRGQRVRGGAA